MRAHATWRAVSGWVALSLVFGFAPGWAFARGGSPAPAPAPSKGQGTVTGTVTDEAGRPVAGAKVVVASAGSKAPLEATTDAMGQYAVRGVPAGAANVMVRARSRVPASVEVKVADQGTAKADATLPLGVRFAGKLRDMRDGPVGGASVQPVPVRDPAGGDVPPLPPDPVTSAADGSFVADGLAPGHSYKLEISHPKFLPVDMAGYEATAGTDRSDIDVTLEDAAWIAGVVMDAAGKPVAKARIGTTKEMDGGPGDLPSWLRDIMRRFGGRVVGFGTLGGDDALSGKAVDSQGRFQIGSLPPDEEVEIAAQAPGYFRSTMKFENLAAGKETGGVKIVLEAATAWVEGVVVDHEGKPVVGAEVEAHGTEGFAGKGKTDAQGKFRIEKLRSRGNVSLSASLTGYVEGDKDEVALNSSGTKLEMKKVAKIRVKVVDAAGKPVAPVTVATYVGTDLKRRFTDFTEFQEQPAEGVLVEVRPGKVELRVMAEGYPLQSVGTWDLDPGQPMNAGTYTVQAKPPPLPDAPPDDGGGDEGGDDGGGD